MDGFFWLRRRAHVALLALMATAVGCSSGGLDASGGTGDRSPDAGTGGFPNAAGTGGMGGGVSSLSLSLKASTTALDPGDVTELSWTVSNAATCEASDGWTGDKPAESDAQRVPVFRDTTYTMTCTDGAGDEVSSSVTVLVSGRLMATVEVSPNPALGGERGLATVVVSNPSDAPVDDVEVKIDIPDYVDPLDAEDYSPGGTCSDSVSCGPGDTITWFIGTLQVGEVVTLLIFPTIAANIPPGTTLSFDLEVTAADEPIVEKSGTTQEGERSLAVSLEQSATNAEPGDEVDYALHYSNPTDQVLQGVVVILLLPPGTELLAASSGAALMADGTVQWTFAELDPGAGGTLSSTVEVDPTLPEGAQLIAKAEGGVEGERTLATTHTALSDGSLEASVLVSPDQVEPGERIMASVTTSNRSLATMENVEVSVLIPEGLEEVPESELSAGGSCPDDSCTAGELATWVIGDLGAGESVTVSLVPVVASTLADGALLTFEIFVSVGGELALQTSATAVETDRTLELRLSESDNPVRPGQSLFYTLYIANQHTANADGTVGLRVPNGTTFVSASGDGALNSEGVVEWPLTNLLPGAGTTREIEVLVDPTLPLGSQLRADATAHLTGASTELRTTAYTPVSAASLVASVGLAPSPVKKSEAASVAVTVSNPGSQAAQNVTVDVRIPPHVDELDQEALSSGGTCPDGSCTEGETASWALGTLDAGDATTLTLPAVVAADASDGSLISFDATIQATDEVPVLSSATTVVDDGRALDLAVGDSPHPAAPGDTVAYVVYFGNTSTASIDGVLTLLIPVGTTVVTISDDGAENDDGEAEWSITDLQPGDSGTREMAVRIDDTLAEGTQLRTEVIFAAGTGESERVLATEQTPVGTSALLLSSAADPDAAKPSDTVTATSTVTNDSGAPVDGVTLAVRIPDGVDAIADGDLPMGGTCPQGACNAGDLAAWSLGTLAPDASVSVSFPATVSASTAPGTLISFEAEAGAGGTALSQALATVSVCSGCPGAPTEPLYFLAGRVSDSVTLGAGLPSETTITSTVDVDHGVNNGFSSWIAAYSAAGQVAWAATLSGGSAEGDGFVRVLSADQDDAGNAYVALQTNTFPGTLTLRSSDNSTVTHTPTVDAGSRHYGVAKMDSEGVWQWYAPIEAEAGSGANAYIKPASTSVYNGRVYVTAEHGFAATGQTVRISDQTGVALTPAGMQVHPVIILDAATGAYIDHRVSNSTTPADRAVMRHNHLIPIAPNQWQESFTVPTVGSVGPSGWYDGSSGFNRRAMDIVVNANDGAIVLADAVQAGVLIRRELDGNADWAYVVNHGGGNTGLHSHSTIGAALETGDGVIFLGGADNAVPPEFNSAGGVITWSVSTHIGSKSQYLVRYAEDGSIVWLTHVNAGSGAGFGLTAGRPENRSVLYDPIADRVYAAYAMPPWPDMGILDAQGTFFKDYNDPLLFGAGEATEESFVHNSAVDGLIVLAAFDGVDGSFLWATSHRRADTQIFQPGSKGIVLNEDGEVVMLLISRAGTTTYGDNKTSVSIAHPTESMVAVRHSVADGSVLGTFIVEDLGSSSGSQTFFEGVFTKSQ